MLYLLVQGRVFWRGLLADRVPAEKVESGEHLLDCTRRRVARRGQQARGHSRIRRRRLTLIPPRDEVGVVERIVGRVDDEFKRVDDFEFASVQGSKERTDDDGCGARYIAGVLGLDRSARVVFTDAENRQRMPGVPTRGPPSAFSFIRSEKGGAEGSHTVLLSGLACSPWLSSTLGDDEGAAEPKVEVEVASFCISHYCPLQILSTDHAGSTIMRKRLSQLISLLLHRMRIEDQG